MNQYCKHNIEKFYRSFIDRTFDQDAVSLFLAASRDYTKKGSVLRELGDFIAHPDEKDRGIVINAIEKIIPQFDEYLAKCRESREFASDPDKLPMFYGIALEDVAKDLYDIFRRAGIEIDSIEIDGDSFREFSATIIIILGACKLKAGGQILEMEIYYGPSLYAQVSYESRKYIRHYASLSVMQLNNVNTSAEWFSLAFRNGVRIESKIARRSKYFGLVAISYEDDLKKGFLDRDSYQPEEIYLLNPRR